MAKRLTRNDYPDEDSAWAAVTILGGYFPDRGRARMEFVLLLERGFAEDSMPTPEWFPALKARAASELDADPLPARRPPPAYLK